jgi:hypothetical protein
LLVCFLALFLAALFDFFLAVFFPLFLVDFFVAIEPPKRRSEGPPHEKRIDSGGL